MLDNNQCVYFTSSNYPKQYPVETKLWNMISQVNRCRRARLGLTFVKTFDINGKRRSCKKGSSLQAIHTPKGRRKVFCNWRFNSELPEYSSFPFRNGHNVDFTWNATRRGRGFKLVTCVVCSNN